MDISAVKRWRKSKEENGEKTHVDSVIHINVKDASKG
jgi:hypothetical protein